MIRTALLTVALLTPGLALACGGSKGCADCAHKDMAHAGATGTTATAASAEAAGDPTHCAKMAELMGANCSYTTGMMAQRVLEEGKPWSYTGTLAASVNALKSRVAAPFTVGPEAGIHVVANEVVETMTRAGAEKGRVMLSGRLLEVDGVSYFVATEYRVQNS